jgi:hypothetical protein
MICVCGLLWAAHDVLELSAVRFVVPTFVLLYISDLMKHWSIENGATAPLPLPWFLTDQYLHQFKSSDELPSSVTFIGTSPVLQRVQQPHPSKSESPALLAHYLIPQQHCCPWRILLPHP